MPRPTLRPLLNADLEPPEEPVGEALSESEEGREYEVHEVSDRDPEILEYLFERGINQNVPLTVEEVAPVGMGTVRTDNGERVSLPRAVAQQVRVAPLLEASH